MITVKLQGGLGNQMFQYAAARGFTKGNEVIYVDQSTLKRNNTDTDTFTAREYQLSVFTNIRVVSSSRLQLAFINSPNFLFKTLRIFFNSRVIGEADIELFKIDSVRTFKSYYLDGYFQSEVYFDSIRPQLLLDFAFPQLSKTSDEMKLHILGIEDSVSIHVRRGDYLKPNVSAYHGVLPISYYKLAVRKIESLISNPHYFIFSDDTEWCHLNFLFLGEKATIVSTHSVNQWEDMQLMSLCSHNIIANSSYSWWAAWLNTNSEKVVLAPQRWFAESIAESIVPKKWISV
jgi:hypothetical protein